MKRATSAQWSRFYNLLDTLLADSAIVAEGVDKAERKNIETGAAAVRAVLAELEANAASELAAERGRQGAALLGFIFGGIIGAAYAFGASGWAARLGAAAVYGALGAVLGWMIVLGIGWLLFPPSTAHRSAR